ncbi:hypothetical protein SELMODRAFT_50691, partial [Selaginella moellendorffii]
DQLAALLRSCGDHHDLEAGRRIHAQILGSAHHRGSRYLANTLIHMYGKCASLADARSVFQSMPDPNLFSWTIITSIHARHGLLDDAKRFFDAMPERNVVANVVSWTVMVSIYIQHGKNREALGLLMKMDLEGLQPNACTFSSVLTACANLGSLEMGKAVHRRAAASGLVSDTVQNALINMYAKCQRLGEAKRLFDQIPVKSDVSWNAIIAAYMYAKLGDVELARKAFEEMAVKDEASWNGIIIAYAQYGDDVTEALVIYERMKSAGVQGNAITFTNVLTACLVSGSLEAGRRIYQDLCKHELEKTDAIVGTVLVNMFARFGDLVTARHVFENNQQRNVISWNGMVMAYSQNGYYNEAVDVFHRLFLEGIQGDNISFTCIFHALSHAGSLDRGRDYFLSMGPDHGLTPTLDLYVSLVDLLGRSGRLNDAIALILDMPAEPDVMSWMTLLGGCKLQGNVELGKYAAERIFELDPEDPSPYVLLSNIYFAAGVERDAESLREVIASRFPEEEYAAT